MDRLQIELQTARQNFADGVPLPIGLLPDPIARSWERSRAAGLSPWQPRLARGRLDILPLTAKDPDFAKQIKSWHELGGTIGYWLIGLHAVAGLGHHYLIKDNTLLRMLPGRS